MTHTVHKSIVWHGLSDGCADCEDAAKYPWQCLDDANFRAAWDLMVAVELDGSDAAKYRSNAESDACRRLLDAARVMERLGLDPRSVA